MGNAAEVHVSTRSQPRITSIDSTIAMRVLCCVLLTFLVPLFTDAGKEGSDIHSPHSRLWANIDSDLSFYRAAGISNADLEATWCEMSDAGSFRVQIINQEVSILCPAMNFAALTINTSMSCRLTLSGKPEAIKVGSVK